MAKSSPLSKKEIELKAKFEQAFAANTNFQNRTRKKEIEEFYFNDVGHNFSQFNDKQEEAIAASYNIPISTKMSYAIVEQMLSFLTATKPFPKLISPEDVTEEFTTSYQKAYHATWSESRGNKQLTKALRDFLNVGEGWLKIKNADFYTQSTTNVIIEYKPWKHVLVDPESEKDDYSDAEYIVEIDVMKKSKAEKKYNIKLAEDNSLFFPEGAGFGISSADIMKEFIPLFDQAKAERYVWVKDYYIKVDKRIFITPDGDISIKRPREKQIPNPERKAAQEQLKQLKKSSLEVASLQGEQRADYETQQEASRMMGESGEMSMLGNQMRDNDEQMMQGQDQILNEMSVLREKIKQMPMEITVYDMEIINYEDDTVSKVTVPSYEEFTKRRIEYYMVVGDDIVKHTILPGDDFPLINFTFTHFNDPNRVFGILHFIQDLVKGQNKYTSQIMYNNAIYAHPKTFVWESTIVESKQLEADYAQPGGIVRLKADPSLQGGGAPIVIDPPPMSQSIQFMLDYFKMLIEYITGIYGVMQGNPADTPSTFGATQSLQNFGSQRIKLLSRQIEEPMERLALVVCNYIKAYCPENSILKYFDPDGNGQEVKIIKTSEDLNFKVRVDIVNSLPTTRQMMAQILGFIAQTAGDPNLTKLLTEKMLKIADIPEANEIAKEMSVVQQMQQQIEQMTSQLEEAQGQVKSAQNQAAQKDIASGTQQAVMQAKTKLDVEAARGQQQIKDQVANATEQEVPLEAPEEEESETI